MTTNTQDALASVAEVAIFGWSLLELLFTRILPLVGFLAGHLLLQFGSLLSSVVIAPTARRQRRPRASELIYSWDDHLQAVDNVPVVNEEEHTWGHVPQAEELAEEAQEKVPVELAEEAQEKVREKDDDHHQNNSESLKISDEEHGEISRRMAEGEAFVSLAGLGGESEKADPAATAEEAALPKPAPPADQMTASNDPTNEKPANGSSDEDAAEVSEAQNIDQDPSDTRERHVEEANTPLNVDAEGMKEGLVSSEEEVSAGQIESKPSSTQTSEQTPSAARSGGKTWRKWGGEGAETLKKSSSRRGSSSILRVLPPSLSQMERTLRQRSRRVTFSHAQD